MDEIFMRTATLPQWLCEKYFNSKDFVSVEDLVGIIEDLDNDLEYEKEEFEEFKQDVEDNYKFVGQGEQIDYNENW